MNALGVRTCTTHTISGLIVRTNRINVMVSYVWLFLKISSQGKQDALRKPDSHSVGYSPMLDPTNVECTISPHVALP